MPTSLSFLGALVATVGFFAGLYGVVLGIIEARRAKASPRLGIIPGEAQGTLAFWVWWDPGVFALAVYRLRVTIAAPDTKVRDTQFTVSWDPPQKGAFIQDVQLPENVRKLLDGPGHGVMTVEFKTVEELSVMKDFKLSRVRKVLRGKKEKHPSIETRNPAVATDHPTVMTLDHPDWMARKKRIKELEAAAKAKAAAKAAAPAAKPVTAAVPAPPGVAATAAAAKQPAGVPEKVAAAKPAQGGVPKPVEES